MSEEILAALRSIADRMVNIESQTSKIDMIEESIRQLAELKAKLQDLETEQVKIKGAVQHTQEVCEEMESRIETLTDKVDDLENRCRRNNLVFYGVLEVGRESWAESERVVRDILKSHLDMELHDMDIDRVHRVGKSGGRPRPIVARFALYKIKMLILGKSRMLQGTNIGLAEDFSFKVRQIRRSLLNHSKDAKRAGCIHCGMTSCL